VLHFAPGIPWFLAFALAAIGIIIQGMGKSGFGGGMGIVAVPLLVIAFGGEKGLGVLLPLLIAADCFAVAHHWKKWDPHIIRILLPGTLLGIAIGSALLWALLRMNGPATAPVAAPPSPAAQVSAVPVVPVVTSRERSQHGLKLIVGIISVLYVVLDQIRLRVAPHLHFKANFRMGTATGAAAGITSTLAHAAGPVAAIYLLGMNLPRSLFVATTAIYFFTVNTVKLIPYVGFGLINLSSLWAGLWLLPFVPLGTWLGVKASRRLNEKAFRIIIMTIVFLTGLQMIYQDGGWFLR
jgi:uncharacterized membrane protein YfcA